MSEIRILAIPPDTHGVGKYRILNPFTYLQEHYPNEFHIDIKFDVPDDDKEFDNYDIVVLHTFIHNKVSPERNFERIKWLKEHGKKVIVDFDDYWEPDMRHPMYLQVKAEWCCKNENGIIKIWRLYYRNNTNLQGHYNEKIRTKEYPCISQCNR